MPSLAERVASRFLTGHIESITRVIYEKSHGLELARVEWIDHRGKPGSTIGNPENDLIQGLLTKAKRERVPILHR